MLMVAWMVFTAARGAGGSATTGTASTPCTRGDTGSPTLSTTTSTSTSGTGTRASGPTLNSATDQGVYVRTACTDTATELGCADAVAGGTDETLDVPVTAGTPVTIFVDGFAPGEAGPFTLTVSVM